MADGGPPTPQPPPIPPVTTAVPPAPLTQPLIWAAQPGPVPQLNWSHFKPEFVGKPGEDAS